MKKRISVVISARALGARFGIDSALDAARLAAAACPRVKLALEGASAGARVSVDWSQLRGSHEVSCKGVCLGVAEDVVLSALEVL